MNIYLAGPMRGYKDFNFPAFFAYADELRKQGHTVFNPAERDVNEWGERKLKTETGDVEEVAKALGMNSWNVLARQVFLHDTEYICKHAEAVALMPGWEQSKGAIAEKALAEAIGLKVFELDKTNGSNS